ncbi:MAG: flagellar motor switch protein FliN [Planctomycetaceae bacterium]|nr:flagellar motor switch protein FliN [Planctomycetaceae bacterium]
MAGSDDDLLDPSEIEALLAGAGAGAPSPPASAKKSQDDLLDPDDIEALLGGGGGGQKSSPSPKPAPSVSSTENLLNEAEANLAAAIANNFGQQSGPKKDTSGATPFALNDLKQVLGGTERSELSLLQDVELDLRIELGRTRLEIEEVVSLRSGSVVPLDKLAGDPVDILVNGKLIARGEVLVLNDNFCVRVAEIVSLHK